MANKDYSLEELQALQDWVANVIAGNKLRGVFPPQIMVHKGSYMNTGFSSACPRCGEILDADFGDYSRPLDEKPIKCSTDEDGHGYWASVINMCIN